MLVHGALANFVSQQCIIHITSMILILAVVPFLSLTGCTGEGAGGPAFSSLSTQTDTTAVQSSGPGAGHIEAQQAGRTSLTSQSTATTASASHLIPSLPSPSSADGSPPGSDSSDDVPMITVTSTATGVTVRLNWQHRADTDASGYYVYYGKQPAQEAGSCASYESSKAVDAPPATITGLEHDTLYYFAVKNFGDSEDICSEEIMVTTPPARS
jgi:hypothetical protein